LRKPARTSHLATLGSEDCWPSRAATRIQGLKAAPGWIQTYSPADPATDRP
jgi:hypothetical protein